MRPDPRRRRFHSVRPLVVLGSLLAAIALILGLGVAPTTGPARALESNYAELTLTELTPSTVTAAGGDTVRVAGRLTNVFDRPLSDLQVSLRIGDRVRTAVGLRTSLMAPDTAFPTGSPPDRIGTRIDPGTSTGFSLEVPISGPDGLKIEATGVYPLQISAVGIPESGGTVQVAESRTLLPVLSLPADSRRTADAPDPAWEVGESRLRQDGSLAADDSAPASFTMIWPLAASPQLAPGVLGGKTEPVRLLSDRLAESLKPEGRLGRQLTVLERLTGDGADKRVRSSLCVAVDPDLLVTVHGMTLGYGVTDAANDPRSSTTVGTGQHTARAWMAKLQSVAKDLCITALPFAQAGLDSLHRIDDEATTAFALDGSADLVDGMLGVESQRGLTIPAIGTLTENGRTLLTENGHTAAAVASSSIEPPVTTAEGRYRSGPVALQTYDAPVTAALGATGTRPVVPSIIPSWQQPDLRYESAVSRRQSAVAALAYSMVTVPAQTETAGAVGSAVTGRSAFIMPPTYWSPTVDDAQALLDTARLLIDAGTARALPLRDLTDALPNADQTTPLATPGDIQPLVAQGLPLSSAEARTIRTNLARTSQLQAALVSSRDMITTPQGYLAPLNEDALRAVATPEGQDFPQTKDLRTARLGAVTSTLDHMQQSVSLLDPGGRYTLASERSPLLLVVRNDLSLPVRVRLEIDAPDALNVGDVGVQEIPPMGTRQIQIPTHASTSERATVKIALATSTGVALSEPVTLSIYSNAYGKPLFWITIAAAIALVLLTARRLWHRFRGQPDRADQDRPEPGEEVIRQAASTPYARRVDLAREEHVEAPYPDPVPTDASDPVGPESPRSAGPAGSGDIGTARADAPRGGDSAGEPDHDPETRPHPDPGPAEANRTREGEDS
ncbi:MAG: DUF6049 family protein [Gordonia sp. (in: high G+C Gram-positive bacteria)]|uniref:DUF6049 family protein n=1 Tax=Gordonia sp. (in: high G+C Gram-positive bacteria) TaxID=84139 RepID=UPI0039E4E775